MDDAADQGNRAGAGRTAHQGGAGGSVREVAASTGITTTTVQKYGRAHGWPTSEQRAGWEADRARNDDFTARIEAATAVLAHLGEAVDDPATAEEPEP